MIAKHRPRRQRNRANFLSGVAVGVGLMAFTILIMDPLALIHKPNGGTGFNTFGLTAVLVIAVIAAFGWVMFGRPYVEIYPSEFVIRNPIKRYRVPISLIRAIDSSPTWARVCLVDGRRIPVAAWETSLSMQLRGKSVTALGSEAIPQNVSRLDSTDGYSGVVQETHLWWDWCLASIVIFWSIYVIVAGFHARGWLGL